MYMQRRVRAEECAAVGLKEEASKKEGDKEVHYEEQVLDSSL